MSNSTIIYKIVKAEEWEAARAEGLFTGSKVDRKDGFIHFSTAEQVSETASLHFAGQKGLLLVAVDTSLLGDDLKWKASRRGQKFPHLYGALTMKPVLWAKTITTGKDGTHVLPMN